MNWMNFSVYAVAILIFWFIALMLQFLRRHNLLIQQWGRFFAILGTATILLFISLLWINLHRPPMSTLGETRLLYAFFLPVIGLITYYRWRYVWFYVYALIMGSVFVLINIFKPENFDKTLSPALQSPWFVPHVIVYIFSYALLAMASMIAVVELLPIFKRFKQSDEDNLQKADNLVYIGFSFLTMGLLFGALWAKEAWGHYWTWDPKEIWAFLTWLGYLLYIHIRYAHPYNKKWALWVLAFSFLVLLICWFGLKYLPAAQNSVHVYGVQ